jgi:hypothetical protein
MVNVYTVFASRVLFLQVLTSLFTGLFVLRHFPPIHMLQAAIALIIGNLLLKVKWKWMPVIGVVYGLVFGILTVPSLFISMFRHIDPEYNAMLEASNPFIGISFLSALFVITILISSLAGLLTNIRGISEPPPAWFAMVRGGFYGAVIFGILVSFYLQLHWVTGINAETIEKLPTIAMKPDSVEPATMEITEGEPLVLRIQNDSDNNCHILSFPELDASVHTEKGRTGLIVIDPKPGTYVYECKSHHDYYNGGIKGVLTVHPK